MSNVKKQDTSVRKKSKKVDEQEVRKKDGVQISADYTAVQIAKKMTQQAAEKYAKPESYTGNRNLYDSGSAKAAAKRKLFNEVKEVIDPYTGQKLSLTKNEAKQLYGEKWPEHLAESDHVKPLEQIYKDTKNNAWNTTDDIKKAANSSDNICVTSRKYNNSKRSQTNAEYVTNEDYLERKGIHLTADGKEQAIFDGQRAEQSIDRDLARASLKNVVETGHTAGLAGAQSAGEMALTVSAISNIVAVIDGKKTGEEAVADTIKDGGKGAVAGYTISGGLTVVAHTLENSSCEFLQALAKSNVPGQIITAVLVTGDTLIKWGNGEITTQQCLLELGEKGLNMATLGYSMAVGQALIPIPVVGSAIGALVGTMLTSTFYRTLISQLQMKELEHQERVRIIAECHAAAEQTKQYRMELESYLQSYFEDYRSCFDTALASMQFAWQIGDAAAVVAGANAITRKLGGTVVSDSMSGFKKFLGSDEVDVL